MQGTERTARTRKWGLLGMAVVVLMLVATMFVIVPTTSGMSTGGLTLADTGGAFSSFVVHPSGSPAVVATVSVGTSPYGAAYDSGKGEVFVSNNVAGTVSVISDSTNAVVATVTVGASPTGAAYDSGKGEVFVANSVSNTVSVISDATNAVVATVPVGTYPRDMAYDSVKGEVFVANANSANVSVISDATNTVVATVVVGTTPYQAAYDAGKGEVFVANSGSNTVSVISDATNAVVATVTVGATPYGASYDSGKGEVFVSNNGAGTVSVISDSTNAVVATVTVGTGPWGLPYDVGANGVFVVNYGANTVSVISDATNTVTATVTVGTGPAEAAYDSGKSEVFVANNGASTVSVISDGSSHLVPASPPGSVYLDNATSTTATATWTGSSASGVLGYNASVYSGLLCGGAPLSTVVVTLPAKLTATFVGLTASTAYSIGVTADNSTGTSTTTCGASANGAGQTTSPYVGWNYWFRNTTATNVTLPTTGVTAVAGNRAFFTARNAFATPVVANSSTLSLGSPEVFYETTAGYLAVENVSTLVATNLTGQVWTWVNTSTAFAAINGYPMTLLPIVAPDNTVTGLFTCSADGTGFYGEVYWLGNHTERFVNAPGILVGTTPASCGYEPGGWFWFVNDTSTGVQMKNVWSHIVVDSPTAGVSPWSAWNGAAYVPIANQIVTDVNNVTTTKVDVRAFQFDPVTGSFNATATFSSAASAFIAGADTNNFNYYYVPNGSKVDVYGLGADASTNANYHLLTVSLGATPSADAVTGLRETQGIGTTDSTFVALPAPYNFSLNGATGAAAGAGPQQAPLIDPLHNTSVWDLGTSSAASWFNGEFDTCIAFCVSSPWASSWAFVRGAWGTSRIAQDAIITPTGTGTAGGTVLLYASALGTTVTTSSAPTVPPAPTGLVVSGVGFTVATLTWVQATGGGILNNTVYLYGGTVCSGTSAAFSTAGAKTTYGFTLLVPGTPYATDVTAWNATGQGAPSSCVTFTTTASVVIPPLPTQSYTWVWLLILLAAVPLVATLLYKMGQPGAGFIGGAERRRERREKRRGGRGGGSRIPLLASGGGDGRFSWPSLRSARLGDAADRFRNATSGAARKLGDATAGARDRIALSRYRLERRRERRGR